MPHAQRAGTSLLALAVCLSVLLPVAATAESWTSADGGPARARTSAIYPGSDLQQLWTGSATSASIGSHSWTTTCVLADDQRVYAVHRDPEDTSVSHLVALDRDTGQTVWTSDAFGRADVECPVLADGLVVAPTGYSPTLDEPTGLRAFNALTGVEAWSTTGRTVTSALSSDGTRVYGSGYTTDPACPTFDAHFAWNLTDGTPAWCVAGSQAEAAPLVVDGAVVVGTRSEPGLSGLDPVTGAQLWSDPEAVGPFSLAGSGSDVAYGVLSNGSYRVRLRTAAGSVSWSSAPLPVGQALGQVAIDANRVYAAATLTDGGQLRLRALSRSSGALSWMRNGLAGQTENLYLLGSKVVAGSLVADRATGAEGTGYNWAALPQRPAFVDGTILGWTANGNGTWSITAVRDTTAPVIDGLSPAAGTATADPTPTFGFTATDGSGSGVSLLEVVVDGVRQDVTGTTSWSPPSALAEGTHTWSISATDALGNSSSSAPRTLVVDSTPPASFSITAPTGDVTTGTPTIQWDAASDGTNGSGIDHYSVVVDSQEAAVVGAGCAPTCEAVLPSVADGTYALEVVAVDGAGLTSRATHELVVAAPPRADLQAATLLTMTGTQIDLDATGSTDNDTDALTFAWSIDGGSFEPGTGVNGVTFGSAGQHTVAVQVTGAGGLSDTATATIDVRLTPPSGDVGVSVNHGAYATNDPAVTVSVVWRSLDSTVRLSNDGSFSDASGASTYDVSPALPWTLVTAGSERLPRTVYARISGRPDAEDRDLTDDIVLDTAPPSVDSAALVAARSTAYNLLFQSTRTVRVHVTASDKAAGVRGFQVTGDRSRPGSILKITRDRKVSTTLRARVTGSRVYVRAIDAAGNASDWRHAS